MSWKPIDLAPRDGSKIAVAFRSPLSDEITVAVAQYIVEEWVRTPLPETAAKGDVAVAWIELPDPV
jgi:hypothetical protein